MAMHNSEKQITASSTSRSSGDEPVVTSPGTGGDSHNAACAGLISRFLEHQENEATRRAYEGDLKDFFGGEPSAKELDAFVSLEPSALTQRLERYQAHLRAR